ncbi:calcium-binding protein, partial [Halomonas daqiaonensis]
SFDVSASDGIKTVTVGGTDFTLADLQGFSQGFPSGVIDTGEGELRLTGYSGTATSGTISYTYTLKAAQDHQQPGNDETLQDSVSVTVAGIGGSADTANLTINILDDEPTFTNIMNAIIANESGTKVTGLHDLALGADGLGTISVADPTNGALDGVVTYTTTTNADSSVTKLAQITKQIDGEAVTEDFFTLTVNIDGTYDFTLHEARPSIPQTVDFSSVQGGAAVNDLTIGDVVFSAVDTDANDSIDKQEKIKPTSAGFGVDNGNVDAGEQFIISFINGASPDIVSFFIKQQSSTDFVMSWVTDSGDYGEIDPLSQNGWVSINPTQDFNTIIFTIVQGSGKIEGVEYTELLLPDDTVFDFDIYGTDADGDPSPTQTLNVTLLGAESSDAQINGTVDDDVIAGTSDNDILVGDDGDDIFYGGAGDDELTGGLGADTFAWNFGDEGTSSDAAEDTVTDFTEISDTDNGKFGFTDEPNADRLDLADLLQGEDEASIGDYIFAKEDGSDIVLHVSSDGTLGIDGANADQMITLEGKSFTDFGANPGDSADLLQQMLDSGQLNIDQ